MSPDPALSEYMTTTEVAANFRVTRRTVLRWADTGVITAFRIGPKTIRFRRADVEALVTPAPVEVAS